MIAARAARDHGGQRTAREIDHRAHVEVDHRAEAGSSVARGSGPACPTPALLTRRSTAMPRRWSSAMSAPPASVAARSEGRPAATLAAQLAAPARRSRSSAGRPGPGGSPRARRARAKATPMPLLAPVTRARRSSGHAARRARRGRRGWRRADAGRGEAVCGARQLSNSATRCTQLIVQYGAQAFGVSYSRWMSAARVAPPAGCRGRRAAASSSGRARPRPRRGSGRRRGSSSRWAGPGRGCPGRAR